MACREGCSEHEEGGIVTYTFHCLQAARSYSVFDKIVSDISLSHSNEYYIILTNILYSAITRS